MKNYWLYVFMLLVALNISCKKENMAPTKNSELVPVSTIIGLDVANAGNASDLRVSFDLAVDAAPVEAYHIFLSKTNSLSVQEAEQLSIESFHNISPSELKPKNILPVELKATDGSDIIEGVDYHIFVLSTSAESNVPSVISKSNLPVTLRKTHLVHTLVKNIQGGSGGMELDLEGNIYMSDFGKTLGGNPTGDKVFKITPDGIISTFMTDLIGASGSAFDSQGNFYQSNIQGGFITKRTKDGNIETFTSGLLNAPVGIAIDQEDNLYIANYGANNIIKMTPEGNFDVYASGNLLNGPNGIFRDSIGNFFIANFNNGAVLKVDLNKEVSLVTTLPGNNNGHLAIHGEWIYVIARSENKIYRVRPNGHQEVFVGSGKRGHEDGPPALCSMSLPNDLAITPDGKRLYFNEVVPTTGGDIKPCNIRYIDIID